MPRHAPCLKRVLHLLAHPNHLRLLLPQAYIPMEATEHASRGTAKPGPSIEANVPGAEVKTKYHAIVCNHLHPLCLLVVAIGASLLVYLCRSALLRHTALRSEDHQPARFPMRRKPPTWMRIIGALLLHAPLVASQDCTFVSGTCLPAGCTDTTLSFLGKSFSTHNLGGLGSTSIADCETNMGTLPHSCKATHGLASCNCATYAPTPNGDGAPILRIKDVGIAGTSVTDADGNSLQGSAFDLIIRNITKYEPWTYKWTYIQGEFGQINMNGPHASSGTSGQSVATTFQFCAVPSSTSDDDFVNGVAGSMLTLDEFPLTFYDLCASQPPPSRSLPPPPHPADAHTQPPPTRLLPPAHSRPGDAVTPPTLTICWPAVTAETTTIRTWRWSRSRGSRQPPSKRARESDRPTSVAASTPLPQLCGGTAKTTPRKPPVWRNAPAPTTATLEQPKALRRPVIATTFPLRTCAHITRTERSVMVRHD